MFSCFRHSVLNVKAVVAVFNQEKALEGAFFVKFLKHKFKHCHVRGLHSIFQYSYGRPPLTVPLTLELHEMVKSLFLLRGFPVKSQKNSWCPVPLGAGVLQQCPGQQGWASLTRHLEVVMVLLH